MLTGNPPVAISAQLLLPDRDTFFNLLDDIAGTCVGLGAVTGTDNNDQDVLSNGELPDPVDDIH